MSDPRGMGGFLRVVLGGWGVSSEWSYGGVLVLMSGPKPRPQSKTLHPWPQTVNPKSHTPGPETFKPLYPQTYTQHPRS